MANSFLPNFILKSISVTTTVRTIQMMTSQGMPKSDLWPMKISGSEAACPGRPWVMPTSAPCRMMFMPRVMTMAGTRR